MTAGCRRLTAGVSVCGALLGLVPFVLVFEQQLGLAALFGLRGAQPPPDDVAIVAISGATARAYGLPAYLREWPRKLHATLIDVLSDAGAAVIVLDIAFEEPRDAADDAALADAIDRAGNVILLEQIRASRVDLPGLADTGRSLRQIPADPIFAGPALGTGPFTLPTVPIRTSQFWVFGAGAADGPMLPSLALQAFLLDRYPEFVGLLGSASTDAVELPASVEDIARERSLDDVIRRIRRLFISAPDLEADLLAHIAALPQTGARADLEALTRMYAGPASRYLNLYGPSGTVATLPFHSVVPPDSAPVVPSGLAGKVVFVGFAENEQSAQQDDFISIYSDDSGLSLSGVEIGATAFANLLDNATVEPLGPGVQTVLLLIWGSAIGWVLSRLPLLPAYGTAALLGGAYLAVSVGVFGRFAYWMPLVVPLGFQLPALVIGDTLLRYRSLALQRERLRRALGPYAAPNVVEQLARETTTAVPANRVVHGTCLVTDVAGYTAVAETMSPDALAELMNEYFALLGRIITAHGGTVGDVSGDSMVGMWVSAGESPATAEQAVLAAREIDHRILQFNAGHATPPLVTPLGIETGALALSHDPGFGGETYRPVGDIVNTAARIQGLNRVLGARLLASQSVRVQTPASMTRRLGRFLLVGKRHAIDVWQIDAVPDRIGSPFAEALTAFADGRIGVAHALWQTLADEFPEDRAVRFYLKQCTKLERNGLPDAWDGTIVMTQK